MNEEWAKEEIQLLGEIKSMNLEILQELQKRHDLITALTLGVMYGIIGSLLVQYSYPVVEKLVSGTYDTIFWIDFIVSVTAALVIIITTMNYYDRLNESSKATENAKAVIAEVDDHIRRFSKMLEQQNNEARKP